MSEYKKPDLKVIYLERADILMGSLDDVLGGNNDGTVVEPNPDWGE